MAPVVAGRSAPGTGLVAPGAMSGGKGIAPVVRDGPATTVGSSNSPGSGPGTGLRPPGSAGSGMAPVVGDEAAAAGETSSGRESTGTGLRPDRLSGDGVPSESSSPKSSPLSPMSSPWKSSFGDSGDGPQGMVLFAPGVPADGRTKKRAVFPIPSDGGAFHHSSGIEAGAGGSSWKSRGSGTEKRSDRVTGTSRSSCGTASDSGTEWPSSSRARMLSGSSFSACSKSFRAPARSPLIFSHRPASSSWLARALTAFLRGARGRRRRAPACAPADPPSR